VPPGRGLRTWPNPGDIRVFVAFLPRMCRALSLHSRPTLVLLFPFFLPRALLGALLERWSGSVCHGRLLQSAVLYHSNALAGVMTSWRSVALLSQRRLFVKTLCAALAVACALACISTVRAARAEFRTPDAAAQTAQRTSPAFDVVEKSISDLQ